MNMCICHTKKVVFSQDCQLVDC
uniref:Uncharacterized protein n=1 Tax=Medicago truncatula TaxID=3880 RepID=I3S4T8_MEDTR|nr:unknown [Medicago truncatula]